MTQSRREKPDIDFGATVEAEELHFTEAPESRVEFSGSSERDSASGSVRRGLPDSVENNVTYRHIRVDYRIRSRIREDSAIVDRQGRSHGVEGEDDGTTPIR